MSLMELGVLLGMATVVAYTIARLMNMTNISWHRSEGRIGAGRLVSVSRSGGSNTHVSETTPAYFQYVRRRYRYAVHCPVQYHGSGQMGDGLVVDMTRDGWRVRGREGMVPGMVLSLNLTIPGAVEAIPISRAVVCWVRGEEFGVKLEVLAPQPAAQLGEFFNTLPRNAACVSQAA